MEHGTRPAHRPAEITQVDLAGLRARAGGVGHAGERAGVHRRAAAEGPPAGRRAADRARRARRRRARSRDVGRSMVRLPVHPRLARMVVARPDSLACVVAALVEERDVLRGPRADRPAAPTSPTAAVAVVCGQTRDDRADRRRRRPAPRAGRGHRPPGRRPLRRRRRRPRCRRRSPPGRVPDRLAGRRRPGQFQLRNGDRRPGSPTTTRWRRRRSSSPPTSTASAPTPASASAPPSTPPRSPALLAGVVEDRRLEWDDAATTSSSASSAASTRCASARSGAGRHRARRRRRRSSARVRSTKLAVLPWTPATLAAAGAGRVPARDARRRRGRTCPTPGCWRRSTTGWRRTWRVRPGGPTSTASISGSCCERCCRGRWAPTSTSWRRRRGRPPGGRPASIDYHEERPTVSVRVQAVFGVHEHPTIAGGRVPLTFSLLSPADRPIQVTADLPGFWTGSWAAVRKDLAGRYPKHRWPERPGPSG